jgi:TonB family protein
MQGMPNEGQMFTQLELTSRGRKGSLLLSIALHCLLLYLLVRPSQPLFLAPSFVRLGDHGLGDYESSPEIVYLVPPETARQTPVAAPLPKLKRQSKAEKKVETTVEPGQAGSPYGSLSEGTLVGYEARPALPIPFPNPAVSRSDIPPGIQGNVVVEVTIDAQGNVVETRVLESLGYGIEDKVLAAVRNWRFRPATKDGVAIASRQDVYFHFPS